FDIRMIEPINYGRLQLEGERYLKEYFKPQEYEWQIKHSNVLEIQPLISSFMEKVRVQTRRPTLEDIDELLADNRLVSVYLNARVLNDKPGYSAHNVLILQKDGDDYVMHDPGLPPMPNRKVARDTVWRAMGGKDNNTEVTGVKLIPRPIRADVLLAALQPDYSRAALAKLFDKGLITLHGKPLKSGEKIKPNSPLVADISSLAPPVEAVDLPVLYEDDDVVVIDKPAGMLTHAQSATVAEATVATFLREKSKELEGERAGVVHRLDRATSGVIIGAKNQHSMSLLQKQFADRTVKKTYSAVVQGVPKQWDAIIDMPIERNPKAPATFRTGVNGKEAVTRYTVLKDNNKYSLLELKPQTGRTHQLRVHLEKIGHPIVGDPLYGKGKFGDRLYLHAHTLEITLPSGERKTFTSPIPPEFEELAS
ncbi:MAG TPA: RluA family pseudouridine synthase, partial [Candidatus Saccharimonadales bacterium]|nr:RluA family pseudouridine synthase [Candidatus Saccharimonadales bacterium]